MTEIYLKSYLTGARTISAKFFSDKLRDVDGYRVVRFAPSNVGENFNYLDTYN